MVASAHDTAYDYAVRGGSSAGRAPGLQPGGRGFESHPLHSRSDSMSPADWLRFLTELADRADELALRWFRTAVRAIASIAWSASVTGLRSGFSWTRSPAVRNHRSASSSARSASSVRKRSQSAGDMESEREWSGWDSNPRPPGCKPGALPAELPPLIGYKDSKRTRGVLRGSRYFGRMTRVTLPRLSTTRIGKRRMSSPSSIWGRDAGARSPATLATVYGSEAA